MPVAPKSVRIQSSCQYLLTLLGSTRAKAEHSTLIKLTPGSISSTYLRTAFTPVAPKSVRIQSSCLLTLLGSTGAKVARRTLMKLTPDFFL